jgi:hypothetical protein
VFSAYLFAASAIKFLRLYVVKVNPEYVRRKWFWQARFAADLRMDLGWRRAGLRAEAGGNVTRFGLAPPRRVFHAAGH